MLRTKNENSLLPWLALASILTTTVGVLSRETKTYSIEDCNNINGLVINTVPYKLCQKGGVIKFEIKGEVIDDY